MLSRLIINSRNPFGKKVKRVYELGQQKVQLDNTQINHHQKNGFPTQLRDRESQSSNQISPQTQYFHQELQNWRSMPFDQLCNLSTFTHHKIHYDLKKLSFSVDQKDLQQIFQNQKDLQVFSEVFSMNPFYQSAYQLLTNKRCFDIEGLKKQRCLATMHFNAQLVQDPIVQKVIQGFVKNLTKPIQIQNYTQPSFVRFLMGIKRDLKIRGVQLTEIAPNSQIKLMKILNYQHQFWYDVYHNRTKNADPQNFIIYEKQIPNPNQSIIMRDNFPTIKIKYVARKKRNKDYQACLCTKAQILLQIDRKQHIIKIQWKSGSQGFGKFKSQINNDQNGQDNTYIVIDFDNLFKGNPTIRSVFDF